MNVIEVNEAPAFSAPSYSFSLRENEHDSEAGIYLGRVSATDPDGDALTYSIVAGNESGHYSIHPTTGEITYFGSGEDYETNPRDTLTIRATDGVLSSAARVVVEIEDVDEDPVVFDAPTHVFSPPENSDGIAGGIARAAYTEHSGHDIALPQVHAIFGFPSGLFAESVLMEVLGAERVPDVGDWQVFGAAPPSGQASLQPRPAPHHRQALDSAQERGAPDPVDGYTIIAQTDAAAASADVGV